MVNLGLATGGANLLPSPLSVLTPPPLFTSTRVAYERGLPLGSPAVWPRGMAEEQEAVGMTPCQRVPVLIQTHEGQAQIGGFLRKRDHSVCRKRKREINTFFNTHIIKHLTKLIGKCPVPLAPLVAAHPGWPYLGVFLAPQGEALHGQPCCRPSCQASGLTVPTVWIAMGALLAIHQQVAAHTKPVTQPSEERVLKRAVPM